MLYTNFMTYATTQFEQKHWNKGLQSICGIDEVGRGCFAGPVVVGAVIFPPHFSEYEGIADSKLLTELQRKKLANHIKKQSLDWAVAEVSVEVINQIGIGKATQLAFMQVLKNLEKFPEHILIDAFYISEIEKQIQSPIKKGDQLSISIAAASIIAKVYRDELMKKLSQEYPHYLFEENKGYGTKLHREMIKNHGLSPLHRTSFNLQKFL
jgi:ribonuclease HII